MGSSSQPTAPAKCQQLPTFLRGLELSLSLFEAQSPPNSWENTGRHGLGGLSICILSYLAKNNEAFSLYMPLSTEHGNTLVPQTFASIYAGLQVCQSRWVTAVGLQPFLPCSYLAWPRENFQITTEVYRWFLAGIPIWIDDELQEAVTPSIFPHSHGFV